MPRLLIATLAACLLAALALPLAAPSAATAQDLIYREKTKYPVLEEIEAARKANQVERDSLIAAADARAAAERKTKRDTARELRLDWSKIQVPAGPDAFKSAWHQPPVAQYYTGSCWAYCSVSFLESEIKRLHDREVKLAEMWIVYWEYVEKARRYIREFGHSAVEEGSQDHGTLEVCRLYGAVPQSVYRGVLSDDGRHDHAPLVEELKGYLGWVKSSKSWDEERNLAAVRAILDKHMGPPPVEFAWQGRSYTPRRFFDEICALDVDDYVSCVSRLDEPFGAYVLLDVRDNWRRRDDYLNLPLDAWYKALRESVKAGWTVVLGGDNSEPGMDGMHDAGVIPEWDIPSKFIDQAARELRIYNRTTGDDHGVHAVGFKQHKGREWFLIKDSNRSSRLGQHKGYYMWDGDFVRLKMLTFLVHKDRLRGLLPQR
ncbi:MAG: C1 family peptidase [Candidatus Krumholzibacteria bacterium]|nr:C1 family peptidase [Candidatus Krumholzibacteria bacterium]